MDTEIAILMRISQLKSKSKVAFLVNDLIKVSLCLSYKATIKLECTFSMQTLANILASGPTP